MTKFNINPGKYRHILEFKKQVETKNTYGEKKKEYVHFLKTRGSVIPVNGREFLEARAQNSELTHKVNIRFTEGITSDMVIHYGSRVFEIISVIDFQERHVELQLLCKERL